MAIEYVDATQLDSDLTSVANAIRAKSGGSSQLTFPAGFVSEIQAIPSGGGDDGKWHRPSNWPDIDSLVPWESGFDSFDGIYCTFDNTGNQQPYAGFWAKTNSGNYVVERGHIENGIFVADSISSEIRSNSTFMETYANCGYMYPIYYVHALSGYFTNIGFEKIPASFSGLQADLTHSYAPCLEITGHVGYVSTTGGIGGNRQLNSQIIERMHLVFGDKANLSAVSRPFYEMRSVKEIDLTYFNTHNWTLTDMSTWFNSCQNLKYIDFSKFDVSNWALTKLSFAGIACLETLDISSWDTTKFNLSSNSQGIRGMFDSMPYLKNVNVSCLDYTLTSYISYPTSPTLENYYPFSLSGNQNFSMCPKLTHDSLLRILNSLPAGSYTLTLGARNKSMLTAEEIAIATDKGWTIA